MKVILIPMATILLSGCYGTKSGSFRDGGGVGGDVYVEPDGSTGEEGNSSEEITIPAGQLTCSALDDNKYYDFWKKLNNQGEEGIFQEYRKSFGSSFNTFNRVKLTINNGSNAYVKLKDDGTIFHVDNLHNAYLFPKDNKEMYEVEIHYTDKNGNQASLETTVKDNDEINLNNEFTLSNLLEIMFVIDATGSMGDEMSYIQAEIDDVIGKVKQDNPTSTVNLAMMVYRDKGDDYVTRYSDFTQDIAKQQEFLRKQSAGGGGDFEEAVDVALNEAINKQWSANSTKLLFHVADAPAHDKDVSTWGAVTTIAASKGIKIITVAASGIDKKTEFFFRSQSLLTSGQYVFLTDDSGIGGSHEKATTEEPLVVEFLNACLIRLINGYHQGEFQDPIPWRQIQ